MRTRFMFGGAAFLIAMAGPLLAAENSGSRNGQGSVELSNGTRVLQSPTLPKLDLNNAQREQIRKSVVTQHSDVEFRLKSTKSAKSFTPQVGEKLPKGVTGHSLPPDVLAQLPQLRDYKYVTMKDKVLIVNAMTKKIVDMFSETTPVT
jgi:hypothetical protein